jgi:hypothetical protein
VNGFLKSIGLDIGLFFKVFSNFMKFLSAIPSDLAKVQKYLDKYEKQSLSVLGKQYNDKFGANEIFEAIANFIPDCLSYFNKIRNETIEENKLIPDARRRSRIIEAQIKKKLKGANSYSKPIEENFISFLIDKLDILSRIIEAQIQNQTIATTPVLDTNMDQTDNVATSVPDTINESMGVVPDTNNEPTSIPDTNDESMGVVPDTNNEPTSVPDTNDESMGGGNKIKQKGGGVQEKFMTVLELLQNVSSQCDGFITDGISLNFTSTPGELRNTVDIDHRDQCQSSGKLPNDYNQQVIKYQIYSILFNTYKSLNRFYNATTSFVDENNNEKISQPSWQDLGATLLSLNQQYEAMNQNEYTTFIGSVAFATRLQMPIRDYIVELFTWVKNAAEDIKTAGKNDNFTGNRTSPRFTPENCGNTNGLSTACRKLNDLWNTLANNQQSSSIGSALNIPNAVKGLSNLEEFINNFFESEFIINLKNAFYEQTLISCMYSNPQYQSLTGNDEIRMVNIKEFEDDIIDMWNEALYDNLDLDETPNIWNWENKNGYTIITFSTINNQEENSVFSLINFITSMLTEGNFIYTLACMHNVLLLNNNTFNPYVSIYSKHTVNPLAQQIFTLYRDCIDKYEDLCFYTTHGIQNVLQVIIQERFQNLSNAKNDLSETKEKRSDLDQLIKLTSPLLYLVEAIKEKPNGNLSFMLIPYRPRNGSKPFQNCQIYDSNTKKRSSSEIATSVPQQQQPIGERRYVRAKRRRTVSKMGGYIKKKTRRRKKRKYKTLRRRKKYRKRTLKRKKRKRKTRFKK